MFWRVAEVRTAFDDLTRLAITSNDWKVFGYLVGRGALWVSLILAVWSMWDYFAYFLRERKKAGDTTPALQEEV